MENQQMGDFTMSNNNAPMTASQQKDRAEMIERFNGGTTLTIGNDQLNQSMSQTLAAMASDGLITIEHHASSRTYRLNQANDV
jgi:hypothetical protein